jgi:hypothetical protein
VKFRIGKMRPDSDTQRLASHVERLVNPWCSTVDDNQFGTVSRDQPVDDLLCEVITSPVTVAGDDNVIYIYTDHNKLSDQRQQASHFCGVSLLRGSRSGSVLPGNVAAGHEESKTNLLVRRIKMAAHRPWYDDDAKVQQFFLWTVVVLWGLWFVICVLGASDVEFERNR